MLVEHVLNAFVVDDTPLVFPAVSVGFNNVGLFLVKTCCDDKLVLSTFVFKLLRDGCFILDTKIGFELLCDFATRTSVLLAEIMFNTPCFFFEFAAENKLVLGHVGKDPGCEIVMEEMP